MMCRTPQAVGRSPSTMSLSRDVARDATKLEVEAIKRDNAELKQLVAELSLEAYRLKKTSIPPLQGGGDAT